jgi:hypothetical protein
MLAGEGISAWHCSVSIYWYNSTNTDFTDTKVQMLAGEGISAWHCSTCIVENESKDIKCQVCGASIPKVRMLTYADVC